MCVQVIQNQNDFLDTRITNVYKVLNLLGPIYCRALYADVHMPGSTKWFGEDEDAAGSLSHVFRINFLVTAFPHGKGIPWFTQKLIGFFVHTNDRQLRIVWQFIDVEDIFHAGYECCVFFWRDAPVLFFVRSQFVFRVLPIASLPTGMASSTFACSSKRRNVHLERPSGAGPQAISISCASARPSTFRRALSELTRFCLRKALSQSHRQHSTWSHCKQSETNTYSFDALLLGGRFPVRFIEV